MFKAAYVRLHEAGLLRDRAAQAVECLTQCRLCPRQCGIDRTAGKLGFCGIGRNAVAASAQVGDLRVDADGVARRGLLVRHLVMPGGVAGSAEIMAFLARDISCNTWVNVMAQYHPCGRAVGDPVAGMRPTGEEYAAAVSAAQAAGLTRLDGR